MWTSHFNINLITIKILLLMVKKIIKSVVKIIYCLRHGLGINPL